MKTYATWRRLRNRHGGLSAHSVFKFGSATLVVFVIAMALMPLTANGALATTDPDELEFRQASSQQTPSARDLQLATDPTPTPTPTPLVLEAEDPPDEDIDDEPELQLDETPDAGEDDPGPVYPVIDIYVTKLGCAGPDVFDAYAADYSELVTNCVDAMNGVSFTLQNAVDYKAQSTGDIQDSMLVWEGVAGGDETISEAVPIGYGAPRAFCSFDDSNFFEVPMADNSIAVATGESTVLYCDWFNVLDPDGVDIYIEKHSCPDGFDASEADFATMVENCTEGMNGVTFTLSNDLGDQSQNTGELDEFSVGWEDTVAGNQFVTETVPPGYEQMVVYCSRNHEDLEPAVFLDASTPTLNFGLDDTDVMICSWYNIPNDGTGDISIWKYHCPLGTDLLANDPDYYASQCAESMDGIPFEVHNMDVAALVLEGTTGDAGPGLVQFHDVSNGTLSILEDIPDGYYDPVVSCTFTYFQNAVLVGGEVPLGILSGGVLEHDFLATENLECRWYNIPRGEMKLTIYKYTCSEGYDITELGANPELDCPHLTNDVWITLDDGAAWHSKQTGEDGEGGVEWSGYEPGSYAIFESLPAGTIAIQVNCVTTSEEGLPDKFSFTPSVDDPTIDLSFYEGQQIICHWFNDPEEEDEGGNLVVNKYWCDGAVFAVEACDLYTGDVSFTVTSAAGDGDPIGLSTSGDGTEELYLPAGAYQIDEDGGPWCYATADVSDEVGNLVIQDGSTTTVDVFNCGPNDDGGKEIVTKYPNTGVHYIEVSFTYQKIEFTDLR